VVRLELSDFTSADGAVTVPVVLRRVSTRFAPGAKPTPEQWSQCRARIDVNRKLRIVDETLADLFGYKFSAPIALLPGQLFEVTVDAEAAELVRFEFEGDLLSEAAQRLVEIGSSDEKETDR
jgi:hypothetical protein